MTIALFSGFLIFESCHPSSAEQPSPSVIQGFLQDELQSKIVLHEMDIIEMHPVDSVMTGKDGSFVFSLFITEPVFYQMSIVKNDPLVLIVNPGEKIQLKGKADSLIFADIQGSEESRLMQEYLIHTQRNLRLSESLATLLAVKSQEKDFLTVRDSILKVFDSIYTDQKQFVKNFILHHPGSLASLIIINQKFGRQVVVDEHSNFDLFIKLDSGLLAHYPKSKHTLNYHRQMAERAREREIKKMVRENIEPGHTIPYFRLPSLDENQWISPSKFKGKKFILAFWIPTQKKSIHQLAQLREFLLASQIKEIPVVAIAFELYRSRWENVVKAGNMAHWSHASDLKGDASPLFDVFDLMIDSLPVFYLIDEQQTIIGRYSSFEDLKKSLAK
ncbi:MAG TPA: DUF4369 domain-containing protein [Bacteroidales bacterium]|nr:DUF4369 domain-containing protein [Bacteroidales bacterium]HPY09881.1 DUF4369 domain-containing protein [Bacteroidales bacterium]